MKVAIMQPYLFPYIGYFQLIAAVDQFVVYDTVKYTKKGWINRNRFLRDGEAITFTLPIEKESDTLDIVDRHVSAEFSADKLLAQLQQAYRRAPHLSETMPLLEAALAHRAANLFDYLHRTLVLTCRHLGIATPIRVASAVEGTTTLRKQDRVIGICERLGATTYVNAIGGLDLYAPPAFAERGMQLRFLRSKPLAYAQFEQGFVPWLSIIDVLMFNSRDQLRDMLSQGYDLIERPEADESPEASFVGPSLLQ